MMTRKLVKPELLAPAGSMEKAKLALLYGADAIYLGGKLFGLRAFANNFDRDEIKDITAWAHDRGKRVYVTVNIFAHNEDLAPLPEYLRFLAGAGVDAILVSDLGVFALARRVAPELALHVSTQANTTNLEAVKAWTDLGAARVVLARELSLEEIQTIGEGSQVELETFVHGAMCISYSGRCWLSSYMTGRDGNRGACAQACRWEYDLVEKTRPGQRFGVEEDQHGTYVMNSRDLCLLAYLPHLMNAGVCSFKIEGRMKSAHYVASVVSVYRRAIDACFADPEHYQVRPEWREELAKVSHRPYTTGFALGAPDQNAQVYTTSSYEQTHEFVGLVLSWEESDGRLYLEQRNHVKEGEAVEILQPDGSLAQLRLTGMRDDAGEPINCAPHAQQKFSVDCRQRIPVNSILRRKIIT